MNASRPPRRPKPARLAGHLAVVAALLFSSLWLSSCARSVGSFGLGGDTSLRFTNGVAEVRHFYAYDVAPPVPGAQWHDVAVARGWTTPRFPGGRLAPPAFHFSDGHVAGVTGTPNSGRSATVSPANYWLMRVPLWPFMVPGLLVGVWRLVTRHDARGDGRPGFQVLPASTSPSDAPLGGVTGPP